MDIIQMMQGSMMGEFISTLCVAMLPVLELRAAIPFGVSLGLTPWAAMIAGVIGNMVPVPFIIAFVRVVFGWLRRKSQRIGSLISRLEARAEGKWEKVRRYELLGLMLLVAIPLPGTGAWTGALIASLLDMRMKRAIPVIFIGVLIAGFLITGLTVGFKAIFL